MAVRRAPFHDLRSYLAALEGAGDLARVSAEVDPRLEIAQITQEAVRRDGPALLFERVKGSPFPVATNLLGSARRIERAFGRPPGEIGAMFGRLGERLMPPTLKAVLSEWRALLGLRHGRPASAAARWSAGETDFDEMPVLFSQPGDAGRFLTFGLVMSADARTGRQNVGVYRMQIRDARSFIMHWQINKGGSTHATEAGSARLPIAVAIGCDPASMFAAVCPLPEGVDELHFAGLLRGASTRLCDAPAGIPLRVPAEAEFLVAGQVHLDRLLPEGPFGDHFGHYSHQAPFPLFEAAAIRRRKSPVYVASVVGKPPQEDRAIGEAITAIFTPIVRLMHPELADMWAYQEAGFHNLLVVSARQRYAKEGIKTALGLLGQGQLSLTKCVVLVDPGVNVRSFPEVLRAIHRHVNPAEDLLVLHRTSQDTLDFTSGEMNLGSKMILDATSAPGAPPAPPVPSEPVPFIPVSGMGEWRAWERTLLVMKPGAAPVPAPPSSVVWQERPKPAADAGEGRALLERFLAGNRHAEFKVAAVVSDDVDLADDASLLWGLFTRFDCARDLAFAESSLRGAWPKFAGPIGIDATFKSGYPDPVTMLPEVVERVRTRWKDRPLPF